MMVGRAFRMAMVFTTFANGAACGSLLGFGEDEADPPIAEDASRDAAAIDAPSDGTAADTADASSADVAPDVVLRWTCSTSTNVGLALLDFNRCSEELAKCQQDGGVKRNEVCATKDATGEYCEGPCVLNALGLAYVYQVSQCTCK